MRDAVFAGRASLSVSMRDDLGRVHRRVPGHVGHVEKQHVDRVGIAGGGIGDDLCIMPCAASGASQEKALSMRSGGRRRRPAGPPARCGKPSGGPASGLLGADLSAAGRRGAGGDRLRDRAACSGSRRAHRRAPSSICRRCIARQVWKPLECAEMPRMACIATGRPTIFRGARRGQSVQGCSSAIACVEGDIGNLGGDARGCVGGRCRSASATASGRVFAGRGSARPSAGRPARACGRRPAVKPPASAG